MITCVIRRRARRVVLSQRFGEVRLGGVGFGRTVSDPKQSRALRGLRPVVFAVLNKYSSVQLEGSEERDGPHQRRVGDDHPLHHRPLSVRPLRQRTVGRIKATAALHSDALHPCAAMHCAHALRALLCCAVQLNSYFRPTGSACDAPRRLCCCLAQRLDITRFGAGRMLSCRAAAAPAVVCVCVPSRVRTPMATGFANTDCSGTLYFGQASMRLAGAAGATVHCALYAVGCLLHARLYGVCRLHGKCWQCKFSWVSFGGALHAVALSARRRTMMDIAVMYGAPWRANIEKAVQVRAYSSDTRLRYS